MTRFLLALLFSLWAVTVYAQTYYVDNDPPHGANCTAAQTITTPLSTVNAGLACLNGGGDILIIRAGTYNESIKNPASLGSGTSWTNKILIQAATNEVVTLRPTTVSDPEGHAIVNLTSTSALYTYIEFDGINLDGRGFASGANVINIAVGSQAVGTGSHHIRFKNYTSYGAIGPGTFPGGPHHVVDSGNHASVVGGNEWVNCVITGGSEGMNSFAYGFYLQGDGALIDNCSVTAISGHAVHAYNGFGMTVSGVVVRNSRFYDIVKTRSGQSSSGIMCGNGLTGMQIYNNILHDIAPVGTNGGGSIWIWACNNAEVYSNTVEGGSLEGIAIESGLTGTIVRNNIVYQAGGGNFRDNGTGTTKTNNLTDGTNPQFMDQDGDDFTLASGSPAIDAGVTVALVTTDINGIARTLGAAPDIGAHESGQVDECDPSGAFPLTFTDTSGTLLQDHNCNWTIQSGSLQIQSNTVTGTAEGFGLAYWPDVVGANYYLEATVTAATAGNYIALVARGQTGTSRGIYCYITGAAMILQVLNPTATTLDTAAAPVVGSVIRLTVIGSAITVTDDGLEVMAATNSDFADGLPGLSVFSNNNGTQLDNLTLSSEPDPPGSSPEAFRLSFKVRP